MVDEDAPPWPPEEDPVIPEVALEVLPDEVGVSSPVSRHPSPSSRTRADESRGWRDVG